MEILFYEISKMDQVLIPQKWRWSVLRSKQKCHIHLRDMSL